MHGQPQPQRLKAQFSLKPPPRTVPSSFQSYRVALSRATPDPHLAEATEPQLLTGSEIGPLTFVPQHRFSTLQLGSAPLIWATILALDYDQRVPKM